jgi:cytochrome c-type biogenesis protein CcmH/NrfF
MDPRLFAGTTSMRCLRCQADYHQKQADISRKLADLMEQQVADSFVKC